MGAHEGFSEEELAQELEELLYGEDVTTKVKLFFMFLFFFFKMLEKLYA
jgi:hypothetical protein